MNKKGIEIERKWRAPGFPEDSLLLKESNLKSIYLYSNADSEARIQLKTEIKTDRFIEAKLTVKTGNGLERIEVESEITHEEFLRYEALRFGIPIIKHQRVYLLLDGHKLYVSFVDGFWYYAEVEFESTKEAAAFVLPYDWEEVTGDPSYQMKNYWKATNS
jgi:hypothetical protein